MLNHMRQYTERGDCGGTDGTTGSNSGKAGVWGRVEPARISEYGERSRDLEVAGHPAVIQGAEEESVRY
jgi:hypothetical protein